MKNVLKVEKLELKIAGDSAVTMGPIEVSFECGPQEFAEVAKLISENIQTSMQDIQKMLQILNLESTN